MCHGCSTSYLFIHLVLAKWLTQVVGWWNIRFGSTTTRFNIGTNGVININGKDISLAVSKVQQFPGTEGWLTFKWGNYMYYLTYKAGYGMIMYRFSIKPGNDACAKTFHGIRYFCGHSQAIKGKKI